MKLVAKTGLVSRAAAVAAVSCVFTGAGCAPPDASPPDGVTFNKDVAPIVFARCAICHRPGESGPFSLLSYEDVARRARQIEEVTASRYMPPWLPAPGVVKFAHERRLSDAELDRIQRWVEAGTPEGDPSDLPEVPQWPRGWQLGGPDLTLTLPKPYVLPAEGKDIYRNFVLPVPVTETRYVRAVEIRPGNPTIAHHAFLRVDRTQASRRLDLEDSEPGFADMRTSNARSPDGHFLGWTPGKVPFETREDMAWRLEPGTDIVLELHMLPTGKPEEMLPRIGLFFGDRPPSRVPFIIRLGSEAIDIPAGERQYEIEDQYELPVDVEVQGIYPHAHYLCKEMRGYAVLPDGSRRWLIHIKEWDFNWQDEYRFAEPISLPKGTKLRMEFIYDNSSDNVRNPNRPPERVRFGPKSSDEMGDLWIQVVPHTPSGRARLEEDFERKQAEIQLQGYAQAVRVNPDDVDKRTSLATSLASLGREDEALSQFRAVLDRAPDFAPAHLSLGMFLMERGQLDEAAVHLERAVEVEPDGVMLLSLGVLRGRQGRVDEAIRRLEQAVAIEPDLANAHLNLGFFLSRQRRWARATEHLNRALAIEPGLATALYLRGTLHRDQGRSHRALEDFRAAIRAEPEFVEPRYELALLLAQHGQLEQATRELETVLRINPDLARAREALNWLRTNAGTPINR